MSVPRWVVESLRRAFGREGDNIVPSPKPRSVGWATLVMALAASAIAIEWPEVKVEANASVNAQDDPATFDAIGADFERVARPLIRSYCLDCHDSEIAEAGIDLEQFDGIDDLRASSSDWQKVARMIDLGEMPPPGADPMPPADRDRLREWIDRLLRAEALIHAGDPGPVILRRLSNAQYTHTIRDLTGLDDLDPAREFPSDGAAGEGFTNAGAAMVMSPSLLEKYLEAAKQVAEHAVLLPDGFRFSPGTSRRDWTDEAVSRIRDFYARFSADSGGTPVNLQGIVFATNEGGRLPLERYFAALIAHRDALQSGERSIEAVASEHDLSPRYLRLLFEAIDADPETMSPFFDPLRDAWRASTNPEDAERLAGMVAPWQGALWRFNSVGHIGKVGGPTAWMEPVSPVANRHEIRVAFPDASAIEGDEFILSLAVIDAGDGPNGDLAAWRNPRIVTPGRPDLALRDLREVSRRLQAIRDEALSQAFACLDAAFESTRNPDAPDLDTLAGDREIPRHVLDSWFNYLGIGVGPPEILAESLLATPIRDGGGYEFVRGWGGPDLPNAVANSSDQHVRIPGNLRPLGVAVHPSPELRVASGWRSPIAGSVTIAARVQHAHPECGNGVTWRLELRRPGTRRRLATGTAQGPESITIGPFEGLPVRPGDLVCLSIGARDGNHSCDLTAVDLAITTEGESWDLATDVSPDIEAGNPHADRLGNAGVWQFFTEPDADSSADSSIPDGSLLARWQDASNLEEARGLAQQIQAVIDEGPDAPDSPDADLYRQLTSLRGPLLSRIGAGAREPAEVVAEDADSPEIGLDPARFGLDPEGRPIGPQDLGVRAPSVIEIRLPAELVAGSEFVVEGHLLPSAGPEASVQFVASLSPIDPGAGPSPERPIVVAEGSPAQARLVAELDAFRNLFPPALCYSQIVPVDEVITLMLHYREDDHLRRLMLDDRQAAELDRLWDELRFISQDALTMVDAFQQLLEYASQDADPSVFEPLGPAIHERADAFGKALVEAEPRQLDTLVDFASLAYRRTLSEADRRELRDLYRSLREESLSHEAALRLTLARVFIAPDFLYRIEQAPPVDGPAPLSSWELAGRLSYFLWSSIPDEALRARAASGELADPDVLAAEARRMLDDDRVRRLAEEFACQWLQVYDFPSLDEKSERHFPSFAALRPAMYEETIRVFTDLFRDDRPVSAILDADDTFLNDELARHYGIDGVEGPEWRRVEGVRKFGRGGILGLGSTLSKQSGASRTSPILRGIWISEVLLGEPLPNPPRDVPELPDDEADTDGLTVRELVERHTRDPRCAGCHARIDPFGFALEGFDAIGRAREFDLADRPVDTRTLLPDQTEIDGVDGLRQYLLTTRRDEFVRQFCRKFLGYALGRGVLLSDEPLLDEMQRQLRENDDRVSVALEAIVRSPQFREIRGRGVSSADVR